MMDSRIATEYNPDLFVLPPAPYRWVLLQMHAWRQERQEPEPAEAPQVLTLVGERGSGKTWLVQYLAEQDRYTSSLAVHLDLEKRAEFRTPEEYVQVVEEAIFLRKDASEIIFLLDHVPPRMDDNLRALEDVLLRPFLVHRRALVIMALVHPSQVCWRTPALRGGKRHFMARFASAQTSEQLQRLEGAGLVKSEPDAIGIQDFSGGLPLLNYLLATRYRAEAFEALLQYWLSRVPEDERESLRSYLDALCMLDFLDHALIRDALEVYGNHRLDAAGCPAHPLGVLNLLRKHWLGQASPNAPGSIVLVESVRRAAREMLKVRDAELYAKLEEVDQILGRRRE